MSPHEFYEYVEANGRVLRIAADRKCTKIAVGANRTTMELTAAMVDAVERAWVAS